MNQYQYKIVETPIGPLMLVKSSQGLIRVAFESEDFDTVYKEMEQSGAMLEDDGELREEERELQQYLSGERKEFDVALDMSLTSGFRRKVLGALLNVGFGSVVSYSELARRAGGAEAVRAAASACAGNPLPIFIPCHRVVRSDGSLGQYRGGVDLKQQLLSMEGLKY